MASQFLQAWIVDATTFSGVLGSRDRSLVARACKGMLADEVREELRSDETLEDVFGALVDGTSKVASWTARRCMTLVADVWGQRIDTGCVLPGRGWQALGPAWRHWGASGIATLWDTEPRWAKRSPLAGAWPRIMWAPSKLLPALRDEAARFDWPAVVTTRGVPPDVPRFGEGEWPLDELSEQIAAIACELGQLASSAHTARKALIAWLDGAQ